MDIKTKFNLGDTVYYIENNKIHQGKVVRIDTTSVLNQYTYNDGSVELLKAILKLTRYCQTPTIEKSCLSVICSLQPKKNY